jgi:hypothetical protein
MADDIAVDIGELFLAVAPNGARLILGARGALAREIAGLAATIPRLVPAWFDAAVDPLDVGLWVVSVDLSHDDPWSAVGSERRAVAIRRAVLGDFGRFSLATPAARNVDEEMMR